MEDENATKFHPDRSGRERVEELQSSSYAELTNMIHLTLLNDIDRHGKCHKIRFSAQDDMWEQEWRQRSGFPLTAFKSRWGNLPRMPTQASSSLRTGRSGALVAGSASVKVKAQSYGLHRKFNGQQAITAIKDLAYGYLNSFPPLDNYSTDRECNCNARQLLESKYFPSWKLEGLQAVLRYRMDSMNLSSSYKNSIGLEFADCDKFDVESWLESILISAGTSQSWDKYSAYLDEITDNRIFDASTPRQWWHFNRPSSYLAIAFIECNLTPGEANEAVKMIMIGNCYPKLYLTENWPRCNKEKHARVEAWECAWITAFAWLIQRYFTAWERKCGLSRFSNDVVQSQAFLKSWRSRVRIEFYWYMYSTYMTWRKTQVLITWIIFGDKNSIWERWK